MDPPNNRRLAVLSPVCSGCAWLPDRYKIATTLVFLVSDVSYHRSLHSSRGYPTVFAGFAVADVSADDPSDYGGGRGVD